MMHVLITGGAGYIGSVLSGVLVAEGFKVTVLDRLYFGSESLSYLEGQINIVQGDTRTTDSSIMDGIDAVIDLAAIVPDAAGDIDPKVTIDINYRGRARIARMAKRSGVAKYIMGSSSNVYGFKEDITTETSQLNPLTTLARSNTLWEAASLPLASPEFCVTVLRQSANYGVSTKMRFDIAFNNMVRCLCNGEKIKIMRDGNQIRPLIHIKDTASLFITVLNAEKELVNGQIFNSGSNEQNYKIFDLGRLASESTNLPFNFEWYGSPDTRSYRISFDKIKKVLGYQTKYTVKEGAKEIMQGLSDGTISYTEKTLGVEWYKKTMSIKKDYSRFENE